MLTDDFMNFIKEECDDPSIGIAHAGDFTPEEVKALEANHRIMCKMSPIYSPDTPVCHPRDFLPNAECVVVIGNNFYFGKDEDQKPGGPPRVSFMNFYVNPDVLEYVVDQSNKVVEYLTGLGYQAETTANGLPVKLTSARSGCGSYGKNAVIQNLTLGSWIGLTLIVTNAPLAIDAPARDYCGKCTKCIDACPTRSIDTPYVTDIERCITLHMAYNKGDIPDSIRENSGTVIAQCDLCLDACPHNKKLKVQDKMSIPKELVYQDIPPLVNLTEEEYQRRFGGSFFEFIMVDRIYLQRNATIALGNHRDPQFIPELVQALESQPEEIVRAGAAWALGKIGGQKARAALDRFSSADPSEKVRSEIRAALARG